MLTAITELNWCVFRKKYKLSSCGSETKFTESEKATISTRKVFICKKIASVNHSRMWHRTDFKTSTLPLRYLHHLNPILQRWVVTSSPLVFCDKPLQKKRFLFRISLILSQVLSQITPENLKLLK